MINITLGDINLVIYRLCCCAKRVGGRSNDGAAAVVAVAAVGPMIPNWFMNNCCC